MSDQFDRASELEQLHRDDALANQQSHNHQIEQPYEHDGVRYCLSCHCSIGTDRLVANLQAVRCVPCQQQHE
ncbi:conjugal transfer protein TraR [Shewanella sp. GutCb]|uniref:TraR/DksA C4-type zinc finger protein n=1 Tax=Shewanella sp. GutCb TaxID=2058315 RepID=UPI000C7A9914|nr:TraR/DksA C4-type zinc finger protein [Shewanella sp. GutCb]PKG74223.1 conjugal transfer protein TraR [Shewanella sp. GutCb]